MCFLGEFKPANAQNGMAAADQYSEPPQLAWSKFSFDICALITVHPIARNKPRNVVHKRMRLCNLWLIVVASSNLFAMTLAVRFKFVLLVERLLLLLPAEGGPTTGWTVALSCTNEAQPHPKNKYYKRITYQQLQFKICHDMFVIFVGCNVRGTEMWAACTNHQNLIIGKIIRWYTFSSLNPFYSSHW